MIIMPETLISIKVYVCYRCGHKWIPKKKTKPVVCPKCHSPYWDTPKNKFKV